MALREDVLKAFSLTVKPIPPILIPSFIRLRQNTLSRQGGTAGMIGLRLRLRPDKMVRRTTAKLVRAKTGWLRRNFA